MTNSKSADNYSFMTAKTFVMTNSTYLWGITRRWLWLGYFIL